MAHPLQQKLESTLNVSRQFIFGQDDLLEGILAALVCQGHLLIEGMPGLGKTLSVSVMSRLCDLDFNRVQFTPDLLPSDLIGTMVFNQNKNEFTTKFGPIFTQILLADEINRSPAKVQAALLEAMAERQVTIGETTHSLKQPFVVLATQNPIEQEGTYQLPEAQLDRFMMKIYVDYPEFDQEKSVLELQMSTLKDIQAQMDQASLQEISKAVNEIYVDEKIKDLIIRMTHSTRPGNALFHKQYQGVISSGASPRASLWLYQLGKFKAFMNGEDHVKPEHLLSVAQSVLGHRIILSYEALIDGVSAQNVAYEIAKKCL